MNVEHLDGLANEVPLLLACMRAAWSIGRWCASRGFMLTAVLVHFIFLGYLFHAHGIVTGLEATKYIGAANDLLAGDATGLFHRYYRFASYILFLVPFAALGKVEFAVIAQIILGLIAAWSLRNMVLRETGSVAWAQVGAAILLLSHVVQEWTLTLYSEPLITSLAIILLDRLTGVRSRSNTAISLLLMLVVLFARPVGVLFVVPAFVHLVQKLIRTPKGTLIASIGLAFAVILVVPMDRELVTLPIVRGEVIFGFPQWPEAEVGRTASTIGEAQLEVFRDRGPAQWGKLFLLKVIRFFQTTRPYFSTIHNALMWVSYPLYLLAVIACFPPRTKTIELALIILLANIVLFGITYIEWHARFITPVWPLIIVLAMCGGHRIHAKVLKMKHATVT